MVALEWTDSDVSRQQLCVQRSAWQGQVAVPKGGRSRYVPMTRRLADALRNHRHLRGPRVLYQDNGEPFTEKTVQTWLLRALAGHADLSTTQRYMQLSPAAIESAIRLLDGAHSGATGSGETANS